MNKKNKNSADGSETVKKKGLDPKMKSWIYTGAFLLAALIFFIVNNIEDVAEQGPYPPNYTPTNTSSLQPAPMFSLSAVNGSILNLADYKGKVVVLDFWATWCPPCRKGIPDLIEIKKQYGDNFEIVGVSVDTETKPDVPGFIKEYGINYPIVYGNMGVYNEYGGIRSIPTAFIINQDGKIFKKYVGLVPKETLVKDINSLLDKS